MNQTIEPTDIEPAASAKPARSAARRGRRSLSLLLATLVASASLLAFSGGAANAAVVSPYGARASTMSYCQNSHTLHSFNYKNFVNAEFAGQAVAERTIVSDANGWHDHGWHSNYGSTTFNTTVYPTSGYVARVYTQYAWLTNGTWHYSNGWNESAYSSIYGGATPSGYCDI